MTNTISVLIKGSTDYITVCNSVAISAAGMAGLDIDVIEDIGIAVTEGCKIISCHDSPCFCNEYKMEIEIDEKDFIISIYAVGDYSVEKHKKICQHCPQEGDLGMAVINTVMDKISLNVDEKNKKRLVMIKHIKSI